MTDPTYTWFDPAGREAEQTRLERQATLYDPITQHVLEAAGIGEGMRVLDLGSGAGDVAILLSRLVGAGGEVVGVDVNAEAVHAARERVSALGIGNVDFVEADLTQMGLDRPFDAIVGRLVLMYLRDPAAVVRRVAALVPPGGILAFLEISWDHLARPETPLFAEIARIIGAAFERTGAHVNMGERLHATFRSAGLAPPQLILERPAGGSERPLTEYLRDELIGLTPVLTREEITTPGDLELDTLVARLDADTDRTGGIVTLWPMVGAWTRI